MLESTYLFIGAVAVLTTSFAVVSTQTIARGWYGKRANNVAEIGGLLGMFSWWLLAYGSLDIRVVGDAVTYSFSQPAVTIWCLMMSIPPLYVAVKGPLEALVRPTETRAEEV